MNPQDFIKTAEFLQRDTSEASIRSLVSRAYYGMILYVKEAIENLIHKKFEKADNIHELIPRYLKHSSLQEAAILAETIQNFRDKRNEADYNMQQKFTELHKIHIQYAHNIIDQFGQLDQRKLEAGIRSYLRTIPH